MDAPNPHRIFDWLWTSGQLSRQDILGLTDLGVEVVINLALPTFVGRVLGDASGCDGNRVGATRIAPLLSEAQAQ